MVSPRPEYRVGVTHPGEPERGGGGAEPAGRLGYGSPMRVLFTFAGGSGHLDPLMPIARATRSAGHAVAVACGPSTADAVEAAGLAPLVSGKKRNEPPERLPLLEVDLQREEQHMRERFADKGSRRQIPRLEAHCDAWRPDLIVCDETDFGGMLVAERREIPHATVLVLAEGSFVRAEVVAEPLDRVRADLGLPADPDLRMPSRYLVLAPMPPALRNPAFPLPPTGHALRPAVLDQSAPSAAIPPWLATRLASRVEGPTVYFTLGTVFNLESGDLFSRVLAGLRDLPATIIVTVGANIDPAEFGPQPGNIHIERFIPQAAVLPHCDVVVSHGGSGSVVGALTFGLPSVLLPMGADQPHNAARCADLGVARVLDAVRATPQDVHTAVSQTLADSAMRRAAERIQREIADLPGPERAVELLEQLATDRRPLVSTGQ